MSFEVCLWVKTFFKVYKFFDLFPFTNRRKRRAHHCVKSDALLWNLLPSNSCCNDRHSKPLTGHWHYENKANTVDFYISFLCLRFLRHFFFFFFLNMENSSLAMEVRLVVVSTHYCKYGNGFSAPHSTVSCNLPKMPSGDCQLIILRINPLASATSSWRLEMPGRSGTWRFCMLLHYHKLLLSFFCLLMEGGSFTTELVAAIFDNTAMIKFNTLSVVLCVCVWFV